MKQGLHASSLQNPEACYHKGCGSYLNPIKIIALSGTAQEQLRIKGTECTIVFDQIERDQWSSKAVCMSSDMFPLLQCKAEAPLVSIQHNPRQLTNRIRDRYDKNSTERGKKGWRKLNKWNTSNFWNTWPYNGLYCVQGSIHKGNFS